MSARIITLPTNDGFPTRGYLYEPEVTSSRAPVVLIAPATGVPAKYHDAFAIWIAEELRLSTLVVDYRYCGISFPPGTNPDDPDQRVKSLIDGKDVTIGVSWREDVRSAFRFIRKRFPLSSGVSYIGNSVGAHLLPITQSPEDKVLRALFIGANLPYWEYHHPTQQRYEAILMLRSRIEELGYFPSSEFGLGDDITAGAGRDWFRWMMHPRYSAGEFTDEFDNFKGRILSICFTDDLIGAYPGRRAIDRTLHTLPLAECTRIELDPTEHNWPKVGHSGVFNSRLRETVWPLLGHWIAHGAIADELDMGDRWESSGFGSHPAAMRAKI